MIDLPIFIGVVIGLAATLIFIRVRAYLNAPDRERRE